MADESTTEHLSPEIFVDLLDGAPLDAAYRQHLRNCSGCRQELAGLERTLSVVGPALAGEVEGPDSTVSPMDRTAKTEWRYAVWASAAAVLLSVLVSRPRHPSVTSTAAEYETLLAPIEEDEDYRLLLTLSRDVEDPEFLFDAVQYKAPFSPDPNELTPAEQTSLLGALARALRSSS